MTDLRALVARMADELDYCHQLLTDNRLDTHELAVEARSALAQQAAPPADGEVRELVEGLRLISDGMSAIGHEIDSWFVARAAELLERLASPPCLVLKPSPELIEAFRESLKEPGVYVPMQPGECLVEPTDEELLGLGDLQNAWNAQADNFNTWDELGLDEIIWWTQRQALARWGNHSAIAGNSPQVDTDAVLRLAEIIREVDGSHSLGAAALAEAILSHPGPRWCRPAPQPIAVAAVTKESLTTEPIPVTERLPEAGDCDAEGRCWWWYPPVPGQTYGYWLHEDDATDRAPDEWPTHWLPAHALPVPHQEPSA